MPLPSCGQHAICVGRLRPPHLRGLPRRQILRVAWRCAPEPSLRRRRTL